LAGTGVAPSSRATRSARGITGRQLAGAGRGYAFDSRILPQSELKAYRSTGAWGVQSRQNDGASPLGAHPGLPHLWSQQSALTMCGAIRATVGIIHSLRDP
jgi:hypothetical protein